MFGRPPPIIPRVGDETLADLDNQSLLKSLPVLQKVREATRLLTQDHRTPSPGTPEGPTLNLEPADWAWIKSHHPATLESRWDGPYAVILTTPSATKAAGRRYWIHHTPVKKAAPDQIPEKWKITHHEDPLKFRLVRSSS